MSKGFSVIVPVFNEERILLHNIGKLNNMLSFGKEPYEIVISDNGSTDLTPILCSKLENITNIRCLKKGLGIGLRKGIQNAKYEKCVFCPADLSYGTEYIDRMARLLETNNLVVGLRQGYDRWQSRLYNKIVNRLCKSNVLDSQGVFGINKSKVKLNNCNTAFFQTKMLIDAKQIMYISTEYEGESRSSKINLIRKIKILCEVLTNA